MKSKQLLWAALCSLVLFPAIAQTTSRIFNSTRNSAAGDSCDDPILINTKGYFNVDNTNGDQWYALTVPESGHLFVSTCGMGTELVDTRIEIYDNCQSGIGTDGLNSNDNYCNLKSYTDVVNAVAGDVIYLKFFDDNNPTTTATYQFFVGYMSDTGYSCVNPTTAVVGSNLIESPLGSTYYRFIAPNSGDIEFSTCGEAFDTWMKLYDDTCTQLDESDDYCDEEAKLLLNNVVAGNEYVIYLWGGSSGETPGFPYTYNLEITYTSLLAVEDHRLNESVIYPNPVSDVMQVKFPVFLDQATIKVIDIAGKQVYEKQNISGLQTNLDLTKVAKGVYFIKVLSNNETAVLKVLKE